jgi:hypothetical protein
VKLIPLLLLLCGCIPLQANIIEKPYKQQIEKPIPVCHVTGSRIRKRYERCSYMTQQQLRDFMDRVGRGGL